MRDTAGRFAPGHSGNPGGRRREGAAFEQAAHRILDLAVSGDALDALPAQARALLPGEPTYHDALAAVLVTQSLAGEGSALRELLKRLWPAPRPIEVSAGEGVGSTLAELFRKLRAEREDMAAR